MNPGMALRIESSTVDAFRKAMADFFPHYVYSDMMLPKEQRYTFSMWFNMIEWMIEWKDIKYSVPTFDITDITFLMVNDFGMPKLVCNFPVLQDWKINAI